MDLSWGAITGCEVTVTSKVNGKMEILTPCIETKIGLNNYVINTTTVPIFVEISEGSAPQIGKI